MVLAYLLFGVAFIWLIASSIVDIQKREAPDWLSYSLIVFGLGSRLIYSLILKDYMIVLFGLLGLLAAFIFAMLMYYTKQWGGGDAKLLMGLGAVIGNFSTILYGYKVPMLVVLIL